MLMEGTGSEKDEMVLEENVECERKREGKRKKIGKNGKRESATCIHFLSNGKTCK